MVNHRHPKQQACNAEFIARHTGGDAVANTVHWREMGIRDLEVMVLHDRVTVLVGDGGYDLKGVTWREIREHIDDLVMTRYEERVARRDAYQQLGGRSGEARRRAARANAHRGGFGDPALAALTQDILKELRAKRMGGQGIESVLN